MKFTAQRVLCKANRCHSGYKSFVQPCLIEINIEMLQPAVEYSETLWLSVDQIAAQIPKQTTTRETFVIGSVLRYKNGFGPARI